MLLSENEIARVRAPLSSAWTLPPAAYTDPGVFKAEAQTLFSREWVCAAHVSQLAEPGDYVCYDLMDQPMIIVRGRDGLLRALSRICLHRAMPLIAGQGNANRFVCPYHNWTYELDGRLRGAPMMDGVEGFETTGCRLPEFALEQWQGFVFVSRDPALPLAPRLGGLSEQLRHYPLAELAVAGTAEYDSPWNWKILVENFMEAYHHIGTHRNSLEPAFPARMAEVPDNKDESWALLCMPARASTGVDDVDPGSSLPAFPDLDDDERHALLAACVFPSTLLAVSESTVFWYQIEPRAQDRMRLRIHVLLHPQVLATLDEAALATVMDEVRFIHEEDIAANKGVWQGVNAPATRQGRLSPYEKAIWQLNQLWADGLNL